MSEMGNATDNKVLSKLMLLQGTLDSMPTDEILSRFLSRGLKSIPGVISLNVCVRGAVAEKNDLCSSCNYRWGETENNFDHLCKLEDHGNTKRLPIRTVDHLYGFVVLSLNDTPDAFTPYEPYLQNIVNVIALSIDNRQQRQDMVAFNKQLQREVEHRKQIEEALRHENIFIEALFESIPGMLYVYDDKGTHIRHNKKHEEMTGYSAEELSHLNPLSWYDDKADIVRVEAAINDIFTTGYGEVEAPMRIKNGEKLLMHFTGSRLIMDGKKYFIGVGTDITASKQAEDSLLIHHTELTIQNEELRRTQDELEASRTRYFDLYDMAPIGYCTVSDTGLIQEANLTFATLLGIERSNLISQPLTSFILPEDQDIYYMFRKHFVEIGRHQESELRIIRKQGTFFWARIDAVMAQDADGKPMLRCAISDIAVSKQTEEKIKLSLREKETLLKEIHHRVKNNLQIISSLLNLQTGYIGDEKMGGIFRECRDRIMAMASVHALLYKSKNLAEIDFGEYVRETTNQLFRSYKTGRMDISLVTQAENVLLPIDTDIPCGLIINELVTNALKHAFPQTGKGEIKIAMNRTVLGIKLLFEDNGIGFPKNTDFYQSETFGLKLVHLLVKQLDGSIEQVVDGGTKYTIMFKTTTRQES